jgi:hypothetical protein
MFDDLVGTDDDSGQPPPGPALMLRAKMGPTELMMHHKMGLKAPLAVRTILFIGSDETTGAECWEPIEAPTFYDGAAVWQKIMGWPIKPTVAEAQAFKDHAAAVYLAEWWDLLAAAKREDDERKPGDPTVGPAGKFAGEAEPAYVSKTEAAYIRAAGTAPIGAP